MIQIENVIAQLRRCERMNLYAEKPAPGVRPEDVPHKKVILLDEEFALALADELERREKTIAFLQEELTKVGYKL